MPGHHFRLGSFAFGLAQPHEQQQQQQQQNSTRNGSQPADSLPPCTKLKTRITVLGSSAVGKTALLHQFLYQRFSETHVPTLDQLYRSEIELIKGLGHTLTLDILDTSGTYEFPAMRRLAIENSDAFILVYSIDDASSFDQLRKLREEILDIKRSQSLTKSRTPLVGRGRSKTLGPCNLSGSEFAPIHSDYGSLSPANRNRKYSVGALCSPRMSMRRRSCVDSFGQLSEQLSQQLSRNLQLQRKLFPESADVRWIGTDRRRSVTESTGPVEQRLCALRNAWKADVQKLLSVCQDGSNRRLPNNVNDSGFERMDSLVKIDLGRDSGSVFIDDAGSQQGKEKLHKDSEEEEEEEEKNEKNEFDEADDKPSEKDDLDLFKSVPIIVVGNKTDLESRRQVKRELAETLVTLDWELGFVECSAKQNFNIAAIFKELMQRAHLPSVAALAFEEKNCRRKSLPAYATDRDRLNQKPKRNSCALS